MASRFAPLADASLDADLAEAARIARDFLSSPVPPQPALGDLRHTNVLASPRGRLANDPKGVSGDPAYAPADTFHNPDGPGARLCDPDLMQGMAARFLLRLGPPSQRLLGRAAAHCALSAPWALEEGPDTAGDLHLLSLLPAAARRRLRHSSIGAAPTRSRRRSRRPLVRS